MQYEPVYCSVSATGTSLCAPNSANSASFPPEAFLAHTFPAQLANSATSVPPQEPPHSSGDLRACEWRNDQGDICGVLVGWHCERHLAFAFEIRELPSLTVIVCGACGEEKKRKFIVRHFRDVHLRFLRRRRIDT
ncbi:hypothetical protein PISMIDRAFT_16121 [Pisolithus microcarpus 441]|uniref:Uncharacterized protein n=1 Tax=Pisolithus microcarpus 441 TaxID=765257 RepID=A0A0C9Z149_9AGAM|nr:hypothetical protein BKA83DRAFT_16121 [Pisolithus microcarpus]KIK15977.1 hypothetical protein PISMIDRAFT_16121 [Pisolithus microcarpus 441]